MTRNDAMNNRPPLPEGSHFADREAARRAVELALPMIERAMADPAVCGSGFLFIVVMDPARPASGCSFEQAVLHEHAIGDRSRWDADYAAFARAKARLAWTHGCDGHAVLARAPHLLQPGDTLLWGSVWLDGIVVGVSGAEPWYDEAFATAVAAALRAIAKGRHAAEVSSGHLAAGQPRGG
jgi:uncharacterized MAPEG superfamily protein